MNLIRLAVFAFALVACGGPQDESHDAMDTGADAGPDPRVTNALGGWTLAVDLSGCEVPDRGVTFYVGRDGIATVGILSPTTMVGAGVELEAAGGRVQLSLADDERWSIDLRDDGTTARAIVTWSGVGPTLGHCETRGEADVLDRNR